MRCSKSFKASPVGRRAKVSGRGKKNGLSRGPAVSCKRSKLTTPTSGPFKTPSSEVAISNAFTASVGATKPPLRSTNANRSLMVSISFFMPSRTDTPCPEPDEGADGVLGFATRSSGATPLPPPPAPAPALPLPLPLPPPPLPPPPVLFPVVLAPPAALLMGVLAGVFLATFHMTGDAFTNKKRSVAQKR